MPINFTVIYTHNTNDVDDHVGDVGAVAGIGEVRFTPQFSDDRPIMADSGGFTIRRFIGYIDGDGDLKAKSGGGAMRLWANDPDFNLTRLYYKVEFELTDPIGRSFKVTGGYFEAPSTDTTVDLRNVLSSTGLPSLGTMRTSSYAEDIMDVTDVGIALITAADAEAARDAIDAVSDFDPRLDDTRAPTDGSVTEDSFHTSVATELGYVVANQKSPYFKTNGRIVETANNDTDATDKSALYTSTHYTNAEEPATGMRILSTSGTTVVQIGGGASTANAATQVEFLTAADTTTTTGTRRGYVNASGVWALEGLLATLASDTGTAGLNIPHGTAPTSPVNGDVWTTTAGLFFRINGTTYSVVAADSTLNCTADQFIGNSQSTATAAGTTTLTNNNAGIQVFTGSTTQTVLLPTTSVKAGQHYTIINQSSGSVTVQSSGANTISTVTAGTGTIFLALKATPTAAADWRAI